MTTEAKPKPTENTLRRTAPASTSLWDEFDAVYTEPIRTVLADLITRLTAARLPFEVEPAVREYQRVALALLLSVADAAVTRDVGVAFAVEWLRGRAQREADVLYDNAVYRLTTVRGNEAARWRATADRELKTRRQQHQP